MAPARIWKVQANGRIEVVAEGFNGPINDLLWHQGRLFVSHRGKVSVLEPEGKVRDIVTGLPSSGDHHNNALAVGRDGKIYLGQGTATNSGVVGLDNIYPFLWLTQYPDAHDILPQKVALNGVTFTTPDALTVLARQGEMVSTGAAVKHILSPSQPLLVKTGAFQPFGRSEDNLQPRLKANGTILRFAPDGSQLEVYAWGLRNPFGVAFGPDGQLYVTDLGFDERGSRPIANAPDALWSVKQNGWYGWPDFAAGMPVTDARFESKRGNKPEMLLKDHPPVEQPFMTLAAHSTPGKFDFSTSAKFGFAGQMFVAQFGSGAPVTEPGPDEPVDGIVRIDLQAKKMIPFARTKRAELGPPGYELAATRGLKHPIEVKFSPDGAAMYVADFGAMAAYPAGAGPVVHPFPGTGAIWRIKRTGQSMTKAPPSDLSPISRADRVATPEPTREEAAKR